MRQSIAVPLHLAALHAGLQAAKSRLSAELAPVACLVTPFAAVRDEYNGGHKSATGLELVTLCFPAAFARSTTTATLQLIYHELYCRHAKLTPLPCPLSAMCLLQQKSYATAC